MSTSRVVSTCNPSIDERDVVREVKRAVPMRRCLHLAGWRVRSRGRADCGLCKGSSKGTIAFNERLWRCHRCGEGGDAFSLIQMAHRCDFITALKFLAWEARVELPDRTKMSAEERQRRDQELAKQKRQREELDNTCDNFEEGERALRLECRRLLHLCDDLLFTGAEWTEEEWELARMAHELRDQFLLPEYTLLTFAPVEERLAYVAAGEVERTAMVSAVRWAGGVVTDDNHFIEVIE